jgi:hypothetical protein
MNSPMAVDVARRVTQRPEFLAAASDQGRVRALYQVLFQRDPQPREVTLAAAFFNAHDPSKLKPEQTAAPKKKTQGKKMKGNAKEGIQNEGEMVERGPLTLWEEYAQALLFTNEIAYVN